MEMRNWFFIEKRIELQRMRGRLNEKKKLAEW